jgi:hypothetical protein
MRYTPYPSLYSRFHHQHNNGWTIQIIKLLIMTLSPPFTSSSNIVKH